MKRTAGIVHSWRDFILLALARLLFAVSFERID